MNHVSERARLFQPGQSGNPSGRPPGSRNKSKLALEALLEGEAEGLTRKAIELAKAGDMTAMRLCMDRIYPARKDTPVCFDMPKLETAADAMKAMAAIMAAVASGDLTPAEANELGKLVDIFTRAIEAHELDERLRRLESATK
jgi:Family of unknown function (DUF5681)